MCSQRAQLYFNFFYPSVFFANARELTQTHRYTLPCSYVVRSIALPPFIYVPHLCPLYNAIIVAFNERIQIKNNICICLCMVFSSFNVQLVTEILNIKNEILLISFASLSAVVVVVVVIITINNIVVSVWKSSFLMLCSYLSRLLPFYNKCSQTNCIYVCVWWVSVFVYTLPFVSFCFCALFALSFHSIHDVSDSFVTLLRVFGIFNTKRSCANDCELIWTIGSKDFQFEWERVMDCIEFIFPIRIVGKANQQPDITFCVHLHFNRFKMNWK